MAKGLTEKKEDKVQVKSGKVDKAETKKKEQLPSEAPVVPAKAEVLSITNTDKGYSEVLFAVRGKVALGQVFELK